MDKNFSLLHFLSQVFTAYGITIGLLNIFCVLFGESAHGISTIFSLGNSGVGVSTSFQFLSAIFVIIGLRFLFMTDILIRKMPLAARISAMFAGVFITILLFIFIFDWFPTDLPLAWIMFIVCFFINCVAGTILSVLAKKQENRRLAEALKRYKEEEE